MESKYSPLLYSYLKKYQDDPKSRVFAPLAEAYRKAGLIEEAIEIAKEGLSHHPEFVGGKVALGRALFDKKEYRSVTKVLEPIVRDVPDNLVAQRLFAESCLVLGRVADALSSYKMLLYFDPTNQETAKLVWELEAQAYEKGVLVLEKPSASEEDSSSSYSDYTESRVSHGFEVSSAEAAIDSDPELRKRRWRNRIERLQRFLQGIERYRQRNKSGKPPL